MIDTPRHRRASDFQDPAVLFVDLKAAQSALDAAEIATPRLAEDEEARFEDMLLRGSTGATLWRSAHIALRIALERHAGTTVRRAAYVINPGGRPQLPNTAPPHESPHFNLSHAGGYALIAISNAGPVGIDIEVERTISMTAERRQHIEAAAARLAPDQSLPEEAGARFLQAWVRLEAAAKASGQGIGHILTKAGIVGAQKDAGLREAIPVPSCPVRDLSIPSPCYAAVAGAQCNTVVAVETFPVSSQNLQRYLAAAG